MFTFRAYFEYSKTYLGSTAKKDVAETIEQKK